MSNLDGEWRGMYAVAEINSPAGFVVVGEQRAAKEYTFLNFLAAQNKALQPRPLIQNVVAFKPKVTFCRPQALEPPSERYLSTNLQSFGGCFSSLHRDLNVVYTRCTWTLTIARMRKTRRIHLGERKIPESGIINMRIWSYL